MTPTDELTERFLPELKRFAASLLEELPGILASAHAETFERAASKTFTLCIDCLVQGWEEVPREQPDYVALCITLDPDPRTPRFDSADVTWGHPSGEIEAAIPMVGMPYSQDALALLEKWLPTLFKALRTALVRGHPTGPNAFPY